MQNSNRQLKYLVLNCRTAFGLGRVESRIWTHVHLCAKYRAT